MPRSSSIVSRSHNPTFKTRCTRCYSYEYTVVDAYRASKKGTRFVTRQCNGCYHRWDVANTSEFYEFFPTPPKTVITPKT